METPSYYDCDTASTAELTERQRLEFIIAEQNRDLGLTWWEFIYHENGKWVSAGWNLCDRCMACEIADQYEIETGKKINFRTRG